MKYVKFREGEQTQRRTSIKMQTNEPPRHRESWQVKQKHVSSAFMRDPTYFLANMKAHQRSRPNETLSFEERYVT